MVVLIKPTFDDVLCGKGRVCTQHPGNIRFYEIINREVPLYVQCKKKEKSIIVRKITDEVTVVYNGRFLKRTHPEPTGWYDAGKRAAREKIGHALRDAVTCYLSAQNKARKQAMKAAQKTNKKAKSAKKTVCTHSQKKQKSPEPIPSQVVASIPKTTCVAQGPIGEESAEKIRELLPPFNSPLETLLKWELALTSPEVSLEDIVRAAETNTMEDMIESNPAVRRFAETGCLPTEEQQEIVSQVVLLSPPSSSSSSSSSEGSESSVVPVVTDESDQDFDGLLDGLDDDTLVSSLSSESFEPLSEDDMEDIEALCGAPIGVVASDEAQVFMSDPIIDIKSQQQQPSFQQMMGLSSAIFCA